MKISKQVKEELATFSYYVLIISLAIAFAKLGPIFFILYTFTVMPVLLFIIATRKSNL